MTTDSDRKDWDRLRASVQADLDHLTGLITEQRGKARAESRSNSASTAEREKFEAMMGPSTYAMADALLGVLAKMDGIDAANAIIGSRAEPGDD
jgi:hypothetical protein